MKTYEAIVKARIVVMNDCPPEKVHEAIRLAMRETIDKHASAAHVAAEITGTTVYVREETMKGLTDGD